MAPAAARHGVAARSTPMSVRLPEFLTACRTGAEYPQGCTLIPKSDAPRLTEHV